MKKYFIKHWIICSFWLASLLFHSFNSYCLLRDIGYIDKPDAPVVRWDFEE